jgi:hypothetical protein
MKKLFAVILLVFVFALANPAFAQLSGPGLVTGGYLSPDAAQTVVNGSSSGTATFSQPFIGSSFKMVVIYCAALSGTASYTFPVAFSKTPNAIATSAVATSVATSVSTTAVTVTGAATGFLVLVGY